MRGYRLLRQSGRIDLVHNLKSAITKRDLGIEKQYFSPTLLFGAWESSELALRQYLLVRCAGVDLNSALLVSVARPDAGVIYAMPRQWRLLVEEYGFRVSHARCALLWGVFVCKMFVVGIVRSVNAIAFFGKVSRTRSGFNPVYAYFVDLVSTNLPNNKNGVCSHDIVSWYLQWPKRSINISCIRHGVIGFQEVNISGCDIQYQASHLPPLLGVWDVMRYMSWMLRAAFVAGADLLRGRWWHSVLLNQAAGAAHANLLPLDELAREYWFHNSSWIYRPIWTYEVERRGADIYFYFYSTNAETFKRLNGFPAPYYGYEAMSWPRYLVWDDYQADFVRRVAVADARIDVVGPIWFQSNSEVLECFDSQSIAVFDVTPTRASWYRILALDTEFYVPETVNPFLEDICDAVRQLGCQVLWKRKRDIGRSAHPRYRTCAERLGKSGNVTLVDPGVSALRVIEASAVTISLPFTSTALLARQMGKPSAFYDPTGSVQADDRAAHGIPVLSGPTELDAWLRAQRQGDRPAQR